MPAKLTILLVDDNPTILKLLRQSLDECGELVTAADGADALLKALDIRADLIISDYSMPVMNGRVLFAKLHERSETANIPSVFMASQEQINERLRTVVEGVEDSLVESFFVFERRKQVRCMTARLYQVKMENMGKSRDAISGGLSELNLIDWMQSLKPGRKTCPLLLRSGRDACHLYFNRGQVTHAQYGDLQGDAGVSKVLTWADGERGVNSSRTSFERTTTLSTRGLMREGVRRLDEARRDAD